MKTKIYYSISLCLAFLLTGCYTTEDNLDYNDYHKKDITHEVTLKYVADNSISNKITDSTYTITKGYENGATLGKDILKSKVERTGFNLLGWSSRSTTLPIIDFDNSYVVDKDIKLYAVWEYSADTTLVKKLITEGKLDTGDVTTGRGIFGTTSGASATGNKCSYCHARAAILPTGTTLPVYVKQNKSSFINMMKQGHNNELNLQQIVHVEAYINSL